MEVNGIILIVSCFKYKQIRCKYGLNEDNILNWKIIYLYGDFNLKEEYKLEDNILTIRCEDTYLHLFKKLILGMKIIRSIFSIKEGILRCGDDLIFNKEYLKEFLKIDNKKDYIGKNFKKKDVIDPVNNLNYELNTNINCHFMINYYKKHVKDKNIVNSYLAKYNISIDDIYQIPNIRDYIALGHIYYLSNNSIDILIKEFDKLNNNIVYYDKKNKYYQLAYEDIGVGYILFKNNINLLNYKNMWLNPHYQNFDISSSTDRFICLHTNEGNI